MNFKNSVFVTGGTGFIGAYLLTELAKRDEEVVALKRKTSNLSHTQNLFDYKFGAEGKTMYNRIRWVDGDIMDAWSLTEAMKGAKDVYHCAAEVDLRDDHPDSIISTAEKGTANMVNVAMDLGIEKFCHLSSVAALGKPEQGDITEECFEEFSFKNAPYSIGKHLAEQQVWRAKEEGLKIVVVSPSIVIGPWSDASKGSMSMFPYIDKISLFYSGGVMGFVDVNDVVNIMLKLMENGPYNERFNATSENVSFKDFFTAIASGINRPLPKYKLADFTMEVFRHLNNMFIKTKISSTMVEHATGIHEFSNKKAREVLNYNFMPVRESVARTAKYYLESKKA